METIVLKHGGRAGGKLFIFSKTELQILRLQIVTNIGDLKKYGPQDPFPEGSTQL